MSKFSKKDEKSKRRRPLKPSKLQPPKYEINQEDIKQSIFEYETKFAGLIPEITSSYDPTSRTINLRIIDKGKKDGNIAYTLAEEHECIIVINSTGIQLLQRDMEELIFQVPHNMVAAASYIKEDGLNILCLKIDDLQGEKFDLVVLSCETKFIATEICAVLEQFFQQMYIDATMNFFDSHMETLSTPGSNGPFGFAHGERAAFLSESGRGSSEEDQESGLRITRTFSDASSAYTTDPIPSYMAQLTKVLNSEELKQFATLLHRWHSNLPFAEFCQKLLEIFGPKRRYLIKGIGSFVSEKDHNYLAQFLRQLSLNETDDAMSENQSELEGATSAMTLCWEDNYFRKHEHVYEEDEFQKYEGSTSNLFTYL